ncbi:MAG: 4Fe-4S binding protein [Clostridiales Family XIII bacterium]|jgi:NAD-dependent dihydropyrimidine dehydrogenase PreA subunit|nr:4Fe-4S binding protein [Clostridiales Family XIII bacterium]
MAYVINDTCTGCGACLADCPAEAISAGSPSPYLIDPDKCIDCGACASACLVGAPVQA